MENGKIYLISDASRKVEVESHVLRYWEDELKLPVKRNELGHRYYTEEDITEFQEIKKLKEQGLQLKAIRMILKNGKLTRLPDVEDLSVEDLQRMEQGTFHGRPEENIIPAQQTNTLTEKEERMVPVPQDANLPEREMEEKVKRLEYLMKKLISEAIEESNQKCYEQLSETLTKELDYQFRMQEERTQGGEEQRRRREEEHYKALDEMLRSYSSKKGKKRVKSDKKKSAPFGLKKKPSII